MKVFSTLLSLVLAGAVFAAMPAGANQAAGEKKATRWQGHVVRIYKDLSQIDLRSDKGAEADRLKKVAYDNATEWTNKGKPGQQDDVKEGSFVIILGQVDDKGVLHAKRIDLRLPR